MLPTRDVSKIFPYQLMTFGFYYLYWCARAGGEVNQALGRKHVPSAWFFIVPFGNYWWGWKYAEAIQELTSKHVKRDDTFLLFALPSLVLPLGTQLPSFDMNATLWVLLVIALVIYVLIAVIFSGLFCFQTQKRINEWNASKQAPATS